MGVKVTDQDRDHLRALLRKGVARQADDDAPAADGSEWTLTALYQAAEVPAAEEDTAPLNNEQSNTVLPAPVRNAELHRACLVVWPTVALRTLRRACLRLPCMTAGWARLPRSS